MSPKHSKPVSDQKRLAEDSDGSAGFTAQERAAMKERVQEMKAAARAANDRQEGEKAVLAKIAEMEGSDRVMAERLHAVIQAVAPDLWPRTWYGMPAYAQEGHVVCFFQSAEKFKSRYATLGFTDRAHLDDGGMWPTTYALAQWTDTEEERVIALLKQAVT